MSFNSAAPAAAKQATTRNRVSSATNTASERAGSRPATAFTAAARSERTGTIRRRPNARRRIGGTEEYTMRIDGRG